MRRKIIGIFCRVWRPHSGACLGRALLLTGGYMSYIWCENTTELDQWQQSLPPSSPLYLDTEFMRERTFWPKLALVQVHDGEQIRLIDCLRVNKACMAPLLSEHTLVMHACSEDLEALAVFAGAYPVQIEDTQIAAALCGEDMQLGYQRIVEHFLGVSLAKGATRTNWLARPLSEEQLHYAEDDVKYLPALREKLVAELQANGRMPWWREECQRLLDQAQKVPDPQKAWRQVKGAGLLDGASLAVLQCLAAWREQQAKLRDLPKGFVIKDEQLLALARSRASGRDWLAQAGLHPKLIRRDGEVLLDLLDQGRNAEPLPPLPGPPDAEQKQQIKVLRQQVGKIADELGLKADVLMRRRWLEALVRHPDKLPEPLTGWRRELVAEPLLAVL